MEIIVCPFLAQHFLVSFFDDQRRAKEEMATKNPLPSNPQNGYIHFLNFAFKYLRAHF